MDAAAAEPRRLRVVEVPSIKEPITRSPGFAKKLLSTWKLDLMALCGFSCSYCSSNAGNYLRINRERFADLAQTKIGERLYPATAPDLVMVWPDIIDKLNAQIDRRPPGWGRGETLVFSMLTDAFSGPTFKDGTTERAFLAVMKRTDFRVRVLTKNSAVGLSRKLLELFSAYRDRVVIGLSTGALDASWARRVEIGTPPPAARLRATRALQDVGVPTFGMLCPIFPGVDVERLVDEIRPERCEHVWAEPFNDRANWRSVRAGYESGSEGWNWMTDVYERGQRQRWSSYATELYLRLRDKARREGWISKLRYLLYEGDITSGDAEAFAGLEGVLLQGTHAKDKDGKDTGRSVHPVFARIQAEHEPPLPVVSP